MADTDLLWEVVSTPTEFVAELREIFPRVITDVVLAYSRLPAYEITSPTPYIDIKWDSDTYITVDSLIYTVCAILRYCGMFADCTGCCCPGIQYTKLDVKIIRPPDGDAAMLENNTLRFLTSGRSYNIPSANIPLSIIGPIYLSCCGHALYAYNLDTQKLVDFVTLAGLQKTIKIETISRLTIIAPGVGPRIFMGWGGDEAMILEWRGGFMHGCIVRAPPRGPIYPLADGRLLIEGNDACVWNIEAGTGQIYPFEEVYGILSNGTIVGVRNPTERGVDAIERTSIIPGLVGYNPRQHRLETNLARETSLGEVVIHRNEKIWVWNQTDGRIRLMLQRPQTKIIVCGGGLVAIMKYKNRRRSDRSITYHQLS